MLRFHDSLARDETSSENKKEDPSAPSAPKKLLLHPGQHVTQGWSNPGQCLGLYLLIFEDFFRHHIKY